MTKKTETIQKSKRLLSHQKSKIFEINKKKLKAVEELVNLMKESRTIIIVSIKNLPTSQFQLIKKKLRNDAVIKVLKKNIINKAIDNIEKGTIKNFKRYLKEDTALIFSKLEPFELSSILSKNKSMARAKVGQVVEEKVVIEAGPTELVPGPVISELGALGLKFSIEDGKINIREKKIILKAGDKVTEQAASIMAKLDMKPVSVGLEPVVAYDAKEDKIYEDIKIDQKKLLDELKKTNIKALGLAVEIAYACKETIGFLLVKARSQETAIEKLIKEDTQQNKPEEKK